MTTLNHHGEPVATGLSRGAPFGAGAALRDIDPAGGRLGLCRWRVNRGGYDASGSYWGLGLPLYCVSDAAGNIAFLRARDREDAKAIVRENVADARFLR
ncbi:hypothetical protein SAMN04515666_101341 [Bosea lupini]|uniref:Uncharacterized protein n=1 Tax=Bosea lupini TaxID=1036779 RepID=A0A1H7GF51_9HYPH|nr:hypothetical protein [Bosea lupini]SEK36906.1 hypothetical protein SAMN04515666_101341 [Bosea lupini]